jgi:quinol monooxygenase YgiN
MHATITTVRFPTSAAREAALDQLARLVRTAATLPGVVTACVVDTGPDELTMFTAYANEAAAESASGELRPALSAAIGPLVSGPPERRAGRVVAIAPERTGTT